MKNRELALEVHRAVEQRRVEKTYQAILTGELREAVEVDRPIERDLESAVRSKMRVVESPGGQFAQTRVEPLSVSNGYTLARVRPAGASLRVGEDRALR